MTDWSICFICQRTTNEAIREGLLKFAENIPKFNRLGRLKFEYSRIANENDDLLTILKSRSAQYHNTCQSNYSDSKRTRFETSNENKLSKAAQKEIENEILEVPEKRSRRSADTDESGSSRPNMFQCCWCTEYDDETNLRAAGQRWAKRKPDSEHMKNITHKWKRIAAVIKHENVLRLLSHGDVSSNELFYHISCLSNYTNQYNRISNANNTDSTNDSWVKELVLNKIILHIKDTELINPGTVFMVGELENMYIVMLDGHGIVCSFHVSRFADLLISRIPGLLKGLSGNKVSLFFDSAVQNNTQNPEDFFDSLVNLVGPVRQAMRLKIQSTDTAFKFDKDNQIKFVPIELLTIINFIQEGINLSEKGFSKESLAIAQAMQFNFRFNRDGKSVLTKKRHDKSKETPFPLYVAIKIYSHSRSKTMINWLYFCAGISISYDRLLSITKDLAARMLRQYERDKVFIPCNLRKNIFTIIAKDNIDVNARSTTATKHYHGTSFSVFQFPLVGFPDEPITYPEEPEGPAPTNKQSISKKIDRLPSSYTEIRRFLSQSSSLFQQHQTQYCPILAQMFTSKEYRKNMSG